MGALARYLIALAPGMGPNAYFTYTVVIGMGVPWETALGAVFLSGLAFRVLTITGASRMIVEAIPAELYAAVAAGIGLFIAFIGLRNAGIGGREPGDAGTAREFARSEHAARGVWIIRDGSLAGSRGPSGDDRWDSRNHRRGCGIWPYRLVAADVWLRRFGSDARQARHQRGYAVGIARSDLRVPVRGCLRQRRGPLVGVTKKAGLVDSAQGIPRMKRILIADATATMVGALRGRLRL